MKKQYVGDTRYELEWIRSVSSDKNIFWDSCHKIDIVVSLNLGDHQECIHDIHDFLITTEDLSWFQLSKYTLQIGHFFFRNHLSIIFLETTHQVPLKVEGDELYEKTETTEESTMISLIIKAYRSRHFFENACDQSSFIEPIHPLPLKVEDDELCEKI